MKKTFTLIGSYITATLIGALLGVVVWPEPSRLSDLPGFMMLAPIFHVVSTLRGLNPNAYGEPIGQSILGPILFVIFLVMTSASAFWFWKTERKWLLLVFALPALLSSLPGTNILYEAISH